MKQILFSVAAAIGAVASFSSFRQARLDGNLYYFIVSGANIVQRNVIHPGQVVYGGVDNPPSVSCPAVIANHYYCVIAVTINEVTKSNFSHLLNNVSGAELQTVQTRTTIS